MHQQRPGDRADYAIAGDVDSPLEADDRRARQPSEDAVLGQPEADVSPAVDVEQGLDNWRASVEQGNLRTSWPGRLHLAPDGTIDGAIATRTIISAGRRLGQQ